MHRLRSLFLPHANRVRGRQPSSRLADRRRSAGRRRRPPGRAVRRPGGQAVKPNAASHRPEARAGLHRQYFEVPPSGKPRPGTRRSGQLPAVSGATDRADPAAHHLRRPRIIFAVGRIAAQNLLDTDTQIGKLRGRAHRFGPARIPLVVTYLPLVVTYHPAYLLRSPREKRKSWDDLRLARRSLAPAPPDSTHDLSTP